MAKKNHPNFPAIPEGQFLLERPRIHRLLAKALECSVLLVSAGEGYGKTYAVSSFLRNRSETTIWVQNSERDNQPMRFWENYTRAMGFSNPQAGKELGEIGFPETPRQFSQWFEISRRGFSVPGKYVVVGDDFHRISSRTVLDFVDRVLSYPIPSHTVVLICRRDPELNIAPALSKGRLLRIGADELLFTPEEIASYFRLRNMDLSEDEIAAIHRDTEGWPLSLDVVATEIAKAGGRYTRPILQKGVFRIFEDDLFCSMSPELQNYLVKLSLFEQWPLELLERTSSVLPEPYGQLPALMAELEKLGAFIRYDFYLQGYRIHQVFLDYLREKQPNLSRPEVKAICAIAARWCLDNNLKMDAAINFERAGDYAALTAIVNSFPRIVPRAAASPLLDLIGRLEQYEDRDESDPDYIYLCRLVRGRLLLCLSRFEESRTVLQENIRFFETQPPSPHHSRLLAESWNYLGSISLIGDGSLPPGFYVTCFEAADRYFRRHPWPLQSTMTIANIGSYVCQVPSPAGKGDFQRRITAFAEGMARAATVMNGYLAGISDLAQAEFTYFQGDLNAAERFALSAVINARGKKQYQAENRGLFFLMRIKLHRGGAAELREVWKQHEALLSHGDYYQRNIINDINNGWMHTQLGAPQKIASWFRSPLEEPELHSMFRGLEGLVKAKYLYAEKRPAELLAFLNHWENRGGLERFLLGLLEMSCLAAVAHYQLGNEAAAVETLETAYQAAAPNALIMPFIELGYDMRLLASAALNAASAIPRPWLEDIRNRASAYGKNLFAITETLRAGEPGENRERPAAVYLTRRERAVLQGLSRGQTREEIAAEIGQPLSVVKSVISSVCGKLGAVNRTGAVHIASALRILEKIE